MWAVLWTDLVQFVIKMTRRDRARGVRGERRRRHGRHEDEARRALRQRDGGALRAPGLVRRPNGHRRVRVDAAPHAGRVPRRAVVGGVVPGRRAGRRRLRRAANLLGADGARRRARDAVFQVAHYALRPWPWIITGLATVILYPNGIGPNQDHEAGYVQAFVDLLPTPWRGFMLAGFAAAYMSTVATQLNWGASYLVNDFYKRFLKQDATEKHYVARLALGDGRSCSSRRRSSRGSCRRSRGAWKFLLALGAGTGLVLILRWYWWRINAWSEISAMLASFAISGDLLRHGPGPLVPGERSANATGDHADHRRAEHGRLAGRHVPDRARSPTRSSTRSTGACARAARAGRGVRRGSASAASRSPAARSPGRTGSPASSRSTRRCSASGRSSSASSATGAMLLVIAAVAFAWIARSFSRSRRRRRAAMRDGPAIARDLEQRGFVRRALIGAEHRWLPTAARRTRFHYPHPS